MSLFTNLRAPPKASPEQAAIIQAVAAMKPREAVAAEARAGTGKTFTLVQSIEAIRRARPGAKVLVLVFGKKAAAEVKARASAGVADIFTCHAFAKSFIQPIGSPVFGKLMDLTKTEFGPGFIRNPKVRWLCTELVDLAMDLAVGLPGELPATVGTFQALIENYAKRLPKGAKADHVAADALKLFGAALKDPRCTFADYGYRAARDGLPEGMAYDFVLVDEAQDLNPIQFRLLDRLRERGAALAFYGDPFQGIYGWRGAGTNSFDVIRDRYAAKVYPIATTRRCAESIVAQAKRIVPDIQAVPDAPEGIVGTCPPLGVVGLLQELAEAPEGSTAVLCRNNAPLLKMALQAVRAGLRVCVLGKAPGQDATYLLPKIFDPARSPTDTRAFGDYLVALRAELADKPFVLQSEEEKVDVVRVLYDHVYAQNPQVDTLADLLAEIQAACAKWFAEDEVPGAFTFSTIHRSKGLEWDNVVFLAPETLPSRAARKAKGWHLDQERNLAYVAVTRARKVLLYATIAEDALAGVLEGTP